MKQGGGDIHHHLVIGRNFMIYKDLNVTTIRPKSADELEAHEPYGLVRKMNDVYWLTGIVIADTSNSTMVKALTALHDSGWWINRRNIVTRKEHLSDKHKVMILELSEEGLPFHPLVVNSGKDDPTIYEREFEPMVERIREMVVAHNWYYSAIIFKPVEQGVMAYTSGRMVAGLSPFMDLLMGMNEPDLAQVEMNILNTLARMSGYDNLYDYYQRLGGLVHSTGMADSLFGGHGG